jgi:hypothetical protein
MKRANACRIAVVLTVLMAATLPGCGRKRAAEPEVTQNPLTPTPGGAPAQGVLRRGVERSVNQVLLHSIGQLYVSYRTETGRAPQNLQEFLTYLNGDPNTRGGKEVKILESGAVVMVFSPQHSSNTVLAYEKEAFQQFQNRLVLFGDGSSVKMMTEPEFQAALKTP